jgi:hypothetical protein
MSLEPTQFTRESAERIANVVRAAELASPAARPLSFERVDTPQKPKLFRVCTFTGAWSINSTKTVTFKNQTATPNTVAAVNLFFPFPAPAAATDCAIAKDGTAWFLIDVPFETATAVFVGEVTTGIRVVSAATAIVLSSVASSSVLTDVTLSASLNTSNCTISIGKTLVTASRTFVSGTSTATVIGSTATSVFVQSTFTSTFLRFKV